MRNISQGSGLCNGTRLTVTQIHPNILEGRIIFGSNIIDIVYIPRIILQDMIQNCHLSCVESNSQLDFHM